MHVDFIDLAIPEDLLDGFEGASEEVLAELLEAGTGERGVEIDPLIQGINFDGDLGSRREGTLGSFASGAETTESTNVRRNVLVFTLKLLNEEIHKSVIEIFSSEVGMTGGGLELENAFFDGQTRHIESFSSKVKDDN